MAVSVSDYWEDIQKKLANNTAKIKSHVIGTSWDDFLTALGWIESTFTYGKNDGKGDYYGMYQYDATTLSSLSFFKGLGGQLLGVYNMDDFVNSALAQEIANLMAFTGMPQEGAARYNSRFTALKNTIKPLYSELYTNFSKLLDQTFTFKYLNAAGDEVGEETVVLSQAGLSAAAHLLGQGNLANILEVLYLQCFTNGEITSSTVTLNLDGGTVAGHSYKVADGNGVLISNYILLFQDYDVSAFVATSSMADFNDLLPHQSLLARGGIDEAFRYAVGWYFIQRLKPFPEFWTIEI